MLRDFHSSLLYRSPIPIVVLDGEDFSVQIVNSAFLDMTKFDEEQLLGAKPPFPWELKAIPTLRDDILEKAKGDLSREYKMIVNKDGDNIAVNVTVSAIRGENSVICYLITMVLSDMSSLVEKDIPEEVVNIVEALIDKRTVELEKAYAALQQELAERMEWEQKLESMVEARTAELKKSKLFWERLFQESPEGVVFLDENDQIIEVNETFCKIFGFESNKLRGLNINSIVGNAPGIQIDAERMTKKLFSGEPVMTDTYRTKSDGSMFPVSIHATSFVIDGRRYAYCCYRDITDRKAGEEQLKYHSKMQSLMVQVAYRFVFPSDRLDGLIFRALEDMAYFFRCSLAGLLQFDDSGKVSRLVTWSKDGYVSRRKGFFDNIRRSDIPWLWRRLNEDDIVVWDDVNSCSISDNRERDLYRYVFGEESVVFYPLFVRGKLSGIVGMSRKSPFSSDSKRIADFYVFCSIISGAIERHESEKTLKENYEILNKTFENTIKTMGDMLKVRDPYTAEHQKRVARLAGEIGKTIGLEESKLNGLKIASLVHDVGKIKVPSEILNKPGLLSPLEFEIIKEHPQLGEEILSNIEFPWPVAKIVAQHHERIDGSGYPRGIEEDEILIESKILAVADVVEAMSSHRPYRPGLGLELALEEIKHGSGLVYDSSVVKACLSVLDGKTNLDFLSS